jgi:tight adherence protein B
MTHAALAAAASAVLSVLAAWDLIGAVADSGVPRRLRAAVAPVRRAGRDGTTPSVDEARRLAILSAITLAAGGWLIGGARGGLAVALAGPAAARAALRARRRRWEADLRAGAPVAARALADAVAGGHGVRGALSAAARGGGVPGAAGRSLVAVAAELDAGERTDVALERLRAGPAFEPVVAALLLARDSGGDLAGLLRDLADALDAAARVEADARVATAQARFTARVVAVLPFGGAAIAELASPGYVGKLLAAPLTAWLAGCALALQVGGVVLVNRLGRLDR